MKTVKILFALMIALVVFNSCNKEYAKPTITWPGTISRIVDFEDDTNYNLDLSLTFAAEAGLSEIKVWKHVYVGLDITSVELDAPQGYSGLTEFNYNFVANHTVADFTGGVTKIVYEFEVKDAEMQEAIEEYTIFVIEAYSVTFNVKDDFDNNITDATITFNGVTKAAGEYVFEYIEAGTYAYTVTKAGFETVTVADFVQGETNSTVDVVLVTKLASAWSADIVLALETQVAWATYNGTLVGIYQSEDIGMAYTFTNAGIGRITKTANCLNWVVISDVAAITNYAQLVAAYDAGAKITQYDLQVDERAYTEVYFAVKIGTEVKLVHYKFGHRSTTTGNIVGFAYKAKA